MRREARAQGEPAVIVRCASAKWASHEELRRMRPSNICPAANAGGATRKEVMDKPFAHSDVPLNARLAVTVSGTGDLDQQAFAARATFKRPDHTSEEWTNAELRSTLRRTLDQPGSYSGRLDVHFARDSTARLVITLEGPDGDEIAAYDESTQSDDMDRTNLLVVVNAAQEGEADAMLASLSKPKKSTKKAAKKTTKKAAKKAVKKTAGGQK
jgi:hypothetical protein